jgi:uncharacterized damage-inducible protein DinB
MDRGAQFRSLADYNSWANQQILAAASALGDQEFERQGEASYGGVQGTIRHILFAQVVWLSRWKGQVTESVAAELKMASEAGREELADALGRADRALIELVAAQSDSDWDRILDYLDTEGKPHRRPLGATVTHLFNHSTYHRGEAALLLTALGRSPGDLDYIYFIPDEAKG